MLEAKFTSNARFAETDFCKLVWLRTTVFIKLAYCRHNQMLSTSTSYLSLI